MVKIALLGASGSIGTSTLAVLREQSTQFSLVLASAHSDHAKLLKIAAEFDIPCLAFTGITDQATQAEIRAQAPRRESSLARTP